MTVTFKDLFQDQIVTGFNDTITTPEILATLGITFVLAIYLFLVYRLITENTFYSKNFNISMVAMAMVTSGIILAMQSSLVISLGMVGALSIVRFRTAIKEPMDLLFLFWAIGTGIICGAGVYKIALILAVCVTVAIIILKKLPDGVGNQMLFVAIDTGDNVAENNDVSIQSITDTIKSNTKTFRLKSQNVTTKSSDFVYEIRCNDSLKLASELKKNSRITSVSIVDSTGEFRG